MIGWILANEGVPSFTWTNPCTAENFVTFCPGIMEEKYIPQMRLLHSNKGFRSPASMLDIDFSYFQSRWLLFPSCFTIVIHWDDMFGVHGCVLSLGKLVYIWLVTIGSLFLLHVSFLSPCKSVQDLPLNNSFIILHWIKAQLGELKI